VQIRRILPVGVVLGATLALGIWLLTYRVWDVVEYIGRDGRPFHPAEHVRIQPWWSVPATVAVLLTGVGVSLWLLPGRRGLLQRLADYFAASQEGGGSQRPRPDDTRIPAP
jgi:hypothetical protein